MSDEIIVEGPAVPRRAPQGVREVRGLQDCEGVAGLLQGVLRPGGDQRFLREAGVHDRHYRQVIDVIGDLIVSFFVYYVVVVVVTVVGAVVVIVVIFWSRYRYRSVSLSGVHGRH